MRRWPSENQWPDVWQIEPLLWFLTNAVFNVVLAKVFFGFQTLPLNKILLILTKPVLTSCVLSAGCIGRRIHQWWITRWRARTLTVRNSMLRHWQKQLRKSECEARTCCNQLDSSLFKASKRGSTFSESFSLWRLPCRLSTDSLDSGMQIVYTQAVTDNWLWHRYQKPLK